MPAKRTEPVGHVHGVPPHVGKNCGLELGHSTRPLGEALGLDAMLDTLVEHDLHPYADTEHGAPARKSSPHDLARTDGLQSLHAGGEGANSWDHQAHQLRQPTSGRQ